MLLILCRKIIYLISVLSVGLFAGFTGFFALIFAPTIKELPPGTALEFFRYDAAAFDKNVLAMYIVMLCSTGSWLLVWFRRYRMVDFYFVLGAFLCVVQEIALSFFGHYRINMVLRSFAETYVISGEVYALREQWAYFMSFHFATNLFGFCLLLAALHRATSGRGPKNNFLAATKT
ncbi:hypothetical protein [Bdellovibrio sp. HCB209]|uniref:hypothetical protein n=1 Tax=Bdellovibrio sp. HCB209 TaxID=3394354 RepID=UPI0039B6B8BE